MKDSGMAVVFCLAMIMPEAHALAVDSTAVTPRQVGQTSRVQAGLAVRGWTDTHVLTVGGAFELRCLGGLPLEAQRLVQASRMIAGFDFTVTVPGGMLPASYDIPGWSEWASPSRHDCTFVYVGRAIEAPVTFGVFGIRVTLGGGEVSDGDTTTFTVVKPVPGSGGGTCIQ